MTPDLIPIEVKKIMQSHTYTLFLLGNSEKTFALYTSPQIGKSIKQGISGNREPEVFPP